MKKKDYLTHNDAILNSAFKLTIDDVLLEPTTGILKSRSLADLNATYIYSSPMDTVTGLDLSKHLLKLNQAPVFCRYLCEKELLLSLNKFHNNKNFWFSVGADIETFNFLKDWAQDKDNVKVNIAVDVAHGDMIDLYKLYNLYDTASWCRNLMSGTVATYESAYRVYRAGCSHIRVGIGPGSACSTRIVTGCGVPNLSAVYEVWSGFYQNGCKENVTIIADGGIRNTGDAVKYLAAGADALMIGNLLSKTIESNGWKISFWKKLLNKLSFGFLYQTTYKYKKYRGQASKEFQKTYSSKPINHVEGAEGPTQYPELNVFTFVNNFNSSIASAISYLGLSSITELNPFNVKFIKISSNSLKENSPHVLNK